MQRKEEQQPCSEGEGGGEDVSKLLLPLTLVGYNVI